MMLHNFFQLLAVGLGYILLFGLAPFWLRGNRLSKAGALDELIISFLYGHIVIILLVLGLSLAGVYSRLTLGVSLVLVSIVYRLLCRRENTLDIIRKGRGMLQHLVDGYYHPRLLLRHLRVKIKIFLSVMWHKIDRPFALAVTLLIFCFAAYTRCYHAITNLFFGSSDMYLHTEWTKMLMHNQPYFAGVYPFGFHAVISAITDVFGFDVVTVMRMMGPVGGMLSVFSLYYLLRRTMRSRFAVNFALAVYVVSDLLPFWAMERQYLALPQEFGTIFLYGAAFFLYIFMRDKEARHLYAFSACVAMTLLTHFFITVFAVLLCGAVFICCISYINWKAFFRLVGAVLCALALAVAPLAAGLVSGIPFNGSMEWALSFIAGEETEDEIQVPDEGETETGVSLIGIVRTLYEEDYFDPGYKESPLNLVWLLPYLASAVLALSAPAFKPRDGRRVWVYAAYSGYSLLLMLLYVLAALDVFAIMEPSRLYVYFIYSVPLVLGVPLEVLYRLLYEAERAAKNAYLAIVTLLGISLGGWIGIGRRFMPLGRVWQAQYNGAVQAYYDIVDEYPRYSWTMISSMSEYSLCLFEGYHYEMADFIRVLDARQEEIMLPTEHVFVYVVKRPNVYLDTDLQRLGDFTTLPEYNPDDALLDMTDAFARGTLFTYRDYPTNRALQAKAAAWAQEYVQFFSQEMTVFYEDDEILVYHIRQSPYAPNQLGIPYPGNMQGRQETDA